MRMKAHWGSHLPVLMKMMAATTGPVLEMGCGLFSTPFLHWACFDAGRQLVSYDHDPSVCDELATFKTKWHTLQYVDDWARLDLSTPWGLALVDHAPGERREPDMRLLTHADFVVAHDTEDKIAAGYGYPNIMELYHYHYRYEKARPNTTVFSNRYDPVRLFRD